MANRNIRAKAEKRNRQLRQLPKHYQHVFMTEGKHKDAREPGDGDQKIYYDTAQYRKRAKGLGHDEHFWDFLAPPRFKGITPERLVVLKHIERIETSIPDKLFFNILSTAYHRVSVYFNPQQTCYILMHTDFNKGVVRTSIEYPSRARCVSAWEADKMIFVHIASVRAQCTLQSSA